MDVYRGGTHIMSMKLLLFLSFLSIFYFLLKTKAAQQTAKSRTPFAGMGGQTKKKISWQKIITNKNAKSPKRAKPTTKSLSSGRRIPSPARSQTENLYKSAAKLQEILSCAWMLWRKMQEKEIIWPFLAEQIADRRRLCPATSHAYFVCVICKKMLRIFAKPHNRINKSIAESQPWCATCWPRLVIITNLAGRARRKANRNGQNGGDGQQRWPCVTWPRHGRNQETARWRWWCQKADRRSQV